jgi:hypothetical protein
MFIPALFSLSSECQIFFTKMFSCIHLMTQVSAWWKFDWYYVRQIGLCLSNRIYFYSYLLSIIYLNIIFINVVYISFR